MFARSIVQMKRGRCEFLFQENDSVRISSVTFPDYSWGFRNSDSWLSIVRVKPIKRVFQLCVGSSGLVSIKLDSVDLWVGVDEDSRQLVLVSRKSTFGMEVVETVNDSKQIVRFTTNGKQYVRHSNYKLRTDPNDHDRSLFEDSLWLLSRVDPTTVLPLPERWEIMTSRALFIHIPECSSKQFNSEQAAAKLESFLNNHLVQASDPKSRRNLAEDRVIKYPLQGAGGMSMQASAMALSMSPDCGEIAGYLRSRIEQATTVKSRGGIPSFIKPTEEVATLVRRLSSIALMHMKRKKMFGMVTQRDFELELGFCEWVILPSDREIVPHRDGGNDCDVAAIFAIANEADVSVEDVTVRLKRAQMYIFEPQKFTHSVSKPLGEGDRQVIALRFFRTYHNSK